MNLSNGIDWNQFTISNLFTPYDRIIHKFVYDLNKTLSLLTNEQRF